MKKAILFLFGAAIAAPLTGQTVYTFSHPEIIPLKLERVSKTMLEVPEEAPNPNAPMVERENETFHRGIGKVNPNLQPMGADPVLQTDYPRDERSPNGNTEKSLNGTTVNVLSSWAGLAASVEPSDNNIAVGPNHVVELTNNSVSSYMRIWNKSGTVLVANKTIKSISGITDYGDPNILYDQAADRFLFVLLYSKNGKKLEVGVSKTNDPTGAWYIYTFSTPGGFPDYPKIGVWGNSYFITTNSTAPTIYALDRATMLAGTSTGTAQMFQLSKFPSISFQSASPVSQTGATLPPANAPEPIIRVANHAWSATLGPDHLEIFNVVINWTTPSNSTITGPIDIDIAPYNSSLCGYGSGNCIPQPGSTVLLDPLSDIVMDKVQYRNFGDHEAMVCSHVCNADGLGDAGVRWYELRKNTAGSWYIYQQSTYSPSSAGRWMSSITINASGEIALGYNISSSSIYPGVMITGRDSCDSLNKMTVPETLVQKGSAANSSIRYGDYNGMVTDPSDGSFWFTGQYNPTSNWGSELVHFTFSSCGNTASAFHGTASIDNPQNLLEQSLTLAPNPAGDGVKISFSSELSGNATIQVMDVSGKLVMEENQQMAADMNTATIGLHSLANGYYLVRVAAKSGADEQSFATRKLVVAR